MSFILFTLMALIGRFMSTHDVVNDYTSGVSIVNKRLEFVHITKTGGSAIEKAGATADNPIIWGACHYMNIEEVDCKHPDLPYVAPNYQSYALTSPWHTPPKILRKVFNSSQHPYNNADLFAVVRNPYDRVLSEYYCPWLGFQAKYRKDLKRDKDPNDPINLNNWVINMVEGLEDSLKTFDMTKVKRTQGNDINEDPYNLAQKHYINQAEYVYDGDTKVIENIIHYERLSVEFDALMKKYGLNIRLPPKDRSGIYTDTSNSKRLTYRDLAPGTIAIINKYAKSDFERFGYTMVEKFEDGDEYSLEPRQLSL